MEMEFSQESICWKPEIIERYWREEGGKKGHFQSLRFFRGKMGLFPPPTQFQANTERDAVAQDEKQIEEEEEEDF